MTPPVSMASPWKCYQVTFASQARPLSPSIAILKLESCPQQKIAKEGKETPARFPGCVHTRGTATFLTTFTGSFPALHSDSIPLEAGSRGRLLM